MALQHFREFLCGSMQESFLGFHIECSFHQRRSQTTCYFRPKLSKDQHLSMDLNECRNFLHCSNSNFKFSKHTHLLSGDNNFCIEGKTRKSVWRRMMTNFQHFMGPLNKWGFVQAIAHTKGNLLPQNIVDSTLLEHVHENEESFFSSSCKIFGLKT